MAEQLTIGTVSFKNKAHIELNQRLTAALNPTVPLPWVVVENSPPDTADIFAPQAGAITVVAGVPFNPDHPRPASDHHAQALHKALPKVNTRFLLILDPDFYIISPNWVLAVPAYMQAKGLAVLGVPWHPRWFSKYRDFPAMHCMFIDLAQFDLADLNFAPGSYRRKVKQAATDSAASVAPQRVLWARRLFRRVVASGSARERLYRLLVKPLKSVKGVIVVNLRGRTKINKTPDTGYAFAQQCKAKALPFEFIPVVFYRHEYPFRPRWLNRLIDAVVPAKNSIRPRQAGYYVGSGFRAAGLPDTTQYACEEFMWQGQPFGFHVRSVPRTIKQNPLTIEQLNQIIAGIMAQLNMPTD